MHHSGPAGNLAMQAQQALGRVLNDGGDGDGFCLKKINNISEFSSSKNNHQIIL